MSENWRSWLPDGVAVPGAFSAALANVVEAWSRKWLATGMLRPTGTLARRTGPRPLRGIVWQVRDPGVALGISAESRLTLGALLLDVDAARAGRTDADIALLEKLASICVEDFRQQLPGLLGLRPGGEWRAMNGPTALGKQDVHWLDIVSDAQHPVLHLEIGGEVFVNLVRASLPSRSASVPGDARPAIAALPATLSALLGGCKLTLSELESLACGDVLKLDRALEDPLPLAIDGAMAPRGRATPVEQDGALALKILEPLIP